MTLSEHCVAVDSLATAVQESCSQRVWGSREDLGLGRKLAFHDIAARRC
jgi:hypothetical protein